MAVLDGLGLLECLFAASACQGGVAFHFPPQSKVRIKSERKRSLNRSRMPLTCCPGSVSRLISESRNDREPNRECERLSKVLFNEND